MKIILKHVLKNMWEKKGRTLLIVLAVALSTAIFFSTQSLSKNLENMYLDVMKKEFGSADISVMGGMSAASQLFDVKDMEEIRDDYTAVVGAFIATGYIQETGGQMNARLYGYNRVSDLDPINKILLEQGAAPEAMLKDDEIVISSRTAKKYGYQLGNILKIKIAGEEKTLRVAAIAYAQGLFIETDQQIPVIVSKTMLNECYNLQDQDTCIYIDIKETQDMDAEIEKISSYYPDQTVSELLPENTAKAFTDRITVSFYLMSIAVFFISVFLIYSSFKVISLERMPITGVFRSIGATKRMTNWVTLLEALVCALIGGVVGSVGGIGLLHAMLYFSAPQWMHEAGVKVSIEYSAVWLAVSIGFSLLIAFLSVLIPILWANKYTISSLIKSKKEDAKPAKFNPVTFGIKVVILAVGLMAYHFIPNNIVLYYGVLLCVAVLVLLVSLVYDVIKLLSIALRPLIFLIFRHEGIIALKNLNESASTINNVRLLTISMAVFLLISVFGSSLISSISDFYADSRYQISVTGDGMDQAYIDRIETMNQVDDVYPMYSASNIKMEGRNSSIPDLSGIDCEKFLNFHEFHCDGDQQTLLNLLQDGDNILISSTLQISLSLEENDKLTLVLPEGSRTFTVIGFFDTLESLALIDGQLMKDAMNYRNYSSLLIKSTQAEDIYALKESIVIESADYDLQVTTLEEQKDSALESNGQLVSIMQIFSLIVLIIAISGMANNIIISFMDKRRVFAVQRSIGMSKFQLVKIALAEASLTGLIGSLLGITGGLCLLYAVPEIMMALGLRIEIQVSAVQLLVILAMGIVITVTAAIGSAVRTAKMDIIEAIKYE